MVGNEVFKAKTEIENAAYEGLRVGLATRMTNLFSVFSSAAAGSDAQDNFIRGVRSALKSYQIGQSIIMKELEDI